MAAQGSKHLAKYAKVAMEVCQDCEAECRKHESEHQVCKDCASACAACAKECKMRFDPRGPVIKMLVNGDCLE